MDQQKIGQFIKICRLNAHLTQEALGEKVGVTNKTVSRWENGNYMPDIATMTALCQLFHISLNELVAGEYLDPTDFKQQADENLVLSLKEVRSIQKAIRVSGAMDAAAVGMLISCLLSSPSSIRTAVIILCLTLLGVSSLIHTFYRNYFNTPSKLN